MFRTGSRLCHYYQKGPSDLDVSVQRKLDYLIKTAAHNQDIVLKSNAVAYPYKHIVMRHEILVRAGFFKMIPYHKLHKQSFTIQPKTQRDKYFPPTDIVCTNDTAFLRKCTNNSLSLNELAAFEEIFEANYEKWGLREEASLPEAGRPTADGETEGDELRTDPAEYSDAATLFNSKDMSEFYY